VVTTTVTPIARVTQRQRGDGGRPSGNSSKIKAVRPSKGTNATLPIQAIEPAHRSIPAPPADT
jgi:hypothetical protein